VEEYPAAPDEGRVRSETGSPDVERVPFLDFAPQVFRFLRLKFGIDEKGYKASIQGKTEAMIEKFTVRFHIATTAEAAAAGLGVRLLSAALCVIEGDNNSRMLIAPLSTRSVCACVHRVCRRVAAAPSSTSARTASTS
jgi:hypothetical protein